MRTRIGRLVWICLPLVMGCPQVDPNFDFDEDGWDDTNDCDPSDPQVHPEAEEVSDCKDNDCDGVIDEETVTHDDDQDGYCEGGDLGDGIQCCDGSEPNDCDDTDSAVSPGEDEACDGLDTNCDGDIPDDEIDDDGDGFLGCAGDCDDTDAAVHPDAIEVCDGTDNDCNPETDEAVDDDQDLYSECDGDCDDGDVLFNPLAWELCDGLDNDCDGTVDEQCRDCDRSVPLDHATIQEALDAAVPADLVCIEPGTYAENLVAPGPDMFIVGIAGPGVTIVDGGGLDRVMTIDGTATGDFLMRGLTLVYGGASYGGGLYVQGSAPRLVNLIIRSNGAGQGGGVYLEDAEVTILNSAIYENYSNISGGGIHITGDSTILIDSTYVVTNQSDYGGGLAVSDGATVSVVASVISNNTTTWSGAGLAGDYSTILIEDSEVNVNHSNWVGGGFYAFDSALTLVNTHVEGNTGDSGGGGGYLNSCVEGGMDGVFFHENVSYVDGGGLYVDGGLATLTDTIFEGNVAVDSGGGLYVTGAELVASGLGLQSNQADNGGGLLATGSVVRADNLRFLSNTSIESCAGALFEWGTADLTGITAIGNQATTDGGGLCFVLQTESSLHQARILDNAAAESGGGLQVTANGPMEIGNATIHGNSAGTYGGGLNVAFGSTAAVSDSSFSENTAGSSGGGFYQSLSTATVEHSNVWANTPDDYGGIADPTGVDGNLALDPLYLDTTGADATSWDLHLDPTSPLVDAGIAGWPDPDAGTGDIGAYGGPDAGRWDLDRDGYFEWWQPGPYDPAYAAEGWDCEDQDLDVYPGQGC